MPTTKPHWLNAERLHVYPRIILGFYLLVAVGLLLFGRYLPSLSGQTLGSDFRAFYAAGWLALQGLGLVAYDPVAYRQAQLSLFPDLSGDGYGWFYPPTALLLVAPFALLPYLPALISFSVAGVVAWWAALRPIISKLKGTWVLVITFPGLWMCLLQGQNGLLTAGLAGGSLLLLRRSPVLSGALLGLLSIKPHLAVLFAVALLAGKAWRVILAAAVTAAGLLAVSVASFGWPVLQAWLEATALAQSATSTGSLPLAKMPSSFAMLRLLGLEPQWALLGYGAVALAAVAAVWLVWRRSSSLPLCGAVLMTATFLVNLYAYDYDLAWLAFPIAWLAVEGIENGWRRGDRESLLALWLLPALGPTIALLAGIQIAPIILGWVVWTALRRVLPPRDAELRPAGDVSRA